jgi:hypothetical protein
LRGEISGIPWRKTLFEIELKPNLQWTYTLPNPYIFDYSKWSFRIYPGSIPTEADPLGKRLPLSLLTFIDGDNFFYLYPEQEEPGCGVIDEIEHHLVQIPELRQLIREKKLKSILDGK